MQTIDLWAHHGLTFLSEFITPAVEQSILAVVANPVGVKSGTGRNSIRRYGLGDVYRDNLVSSAIPECFAPVIAQLLAEQLIAAPPEAVTVNEYLAGQSIQPHIDGKAAGPVITVLSLLSPAVMVFTRGAESFEVGLPPRSLTQMRDAARNEWEHAILPVEATRYSIVFRGKSC